MFSNTLKYIQEFPALTERTQAIRRSKCH